MQLYVSDFIGDTLHLSTEQIGAYMLLLMAMWNAGGALPDEEAKLARVVRMSVKKWRAISDDLMAFFDSDGGRISHNRLTKELQKSESKSQSRASAGAKGGTAKALKTRKADMANAKANGIAKPCHSPDTREKEEANASSKKAFRIPDEFQPDTAWAIDRGLPADKAAVEAEKFRNHWTAKGGKDALKKDWPAAWRTWALNAIEFRGLAVKPAGSKPDREPNEDDWRKRLRYGRHERKWFSDAWGPPPGKPGCKVPLQLIEDGDGKDWRLADERNAA